MLNEEDDDDGDNVDSHGTDQVNIIEYSNTQLFDQ